MSFNIAFIGMGEYTIGCLEHVIQNHKIVGIIQSIRKKEKYSMFDLMTVKKGKLKKYAENNNIPFICSDDLNGSRVLSFLKKIGCDLICVASAGQLLKGEILEVPKYGILNAHSSLLPNYRGANPTYWTFLNQEKTGGITIHYIDKGMDTGNYLVQRPFDIPYKASLSEYNSMISRIAGECYIEALDGLESGTLHPVPQKGEGKCIARRVTSEDYALKFDEFSTKDAYHFLYGTDGINKIHNSLFFDYSIGEPNNESPKSSFNITCKDGYIPVYRSVNPKNIIFKVGGGILKHISIQQLCE